eukprot:TRINITY_DN916_c0_g1_i8.p1 TRINITY_DN916_c0_g1~~TRINITY_DN916_c0_g1_i8.p1  ORF type:complete len:651 (-),score=137.77 TRINITY_DN916_c0_g1_i8:904-2856(-)
MCRSLFNQFAESGEILLLDKLDICLPEIFKLAKLQFTVQNNKEGLMGALISYVTQSEAIEFENSQSELKRGIDFNTLRIYTQNYFIENPLISLHADIARIIHPENTAEAKPGCSFIEQIQKTIQEYTELIEHQREQGEDPANAIKLKNMLINQLKIMQVDKPVVKHQKLIGDNEKALKEIFDFYCKQQLLVGRKATFEQLNAVLSNMNLGEFTKFCKDFGIALPFAKVRELFKKTARAARELDYSLFKELLLRVAHEIFNARLNELKELSMQELSGEVLREIEKLEKCSDEERRKALYEHMEIENPGKYRKKMVGMVLPFNTHDKEFRIPQDSGRKLKARPKRSVKPNNHSQSMVKGRRQKILQCSTIDDRKNNSKCLDTDPQKRSPEEYSMREKKNVVEKAAVRKSIQQSSKIRIEDEAFNNFQKNPKQASGSSVEPSNRYIGRRDYYRNGATIKEEKAKVNKVNERNVKKPVELTWKLLTTLSYNDLNGEKGDEFSPEKIIEEGDSTDIEILKKLHRKESKEAPVKSKANLQKVAKYYGNASVRAPKAKPLKYNKSEQNKVVAKNMILIEGDKKVLGHSIERKGGVNAVNNSYDIGDVLNEEQIASRIRKMRKEGAYKNITKETIDRAQQIEQQEKKRIRHVTLHYIT